MEIKLEQVDFSYKKVNYQQKDVLKNMNMIFENGKITGIMGQSGSGKTTLLELIDHFLVPTNGKIHVGSFEFERDSKIQNINEYRFQVGYVTQFPEEQFISFTVKEELEFNLKLYHYKVDQLQKRVEDSLKLVGLDKEYLNKNPFNLSNGEKRKVAIASVLIYNPKIVLLDEPTVGLDNKDKKSLITLIKMLKTRYQKTIVIVSHDSDFLHQLVDYIYILNEGNVVMEGDKYEVFKQVRKLKKYGIQAPKVIQFSDKVLTKKKIKIGYRDQINDLIKDIYRYVK